MKLGWREITSYTISWQFRLRLALLLLVLESHSTTMCSFGATTLQSESKSLIHIEVLFSFAQIWLIFYRWWPEIPIVLALVQATAIMVDVIYTVYQQEKATSRYTGGSRRMSKMVFHQAIFFVGAFYITWIPYLVLQVWQLLWMYYSIIGKYPANFKFVCFKVHAIVR